jgi:AbrB family looped-hinge helix DNA binding protein
MTSIYRVRISKQGRIVLPKELRESYGVKTGDEAIIIALGKELAMHLHKVSKDPIPVEEPSDEERRAIEEKDEIADEKELMKALGKTNVHH